MRKTGETKHLLFVSNVERDAWTVVFVLSRSQHGAWSHRRSQQAGLGYFVHSFICSWLLLFLLLLFLLYPRSSYCNIVCSCMVFWLLLLPSLPLTPTMVTHGGDNFQVLKL